MKRAALLLAPALALALAGCDRLMSGAARSPDEQRLLDQAEIARISTAIDDAVDRKDWPAARAFFADRIEADFSSLGGAPGTVSADTLIGNWKATLPAAKPSFHMSGQPLIAIDGDSATLVARGYAYNMLTTRPANDNLWEVWGVYRETFARTAQGWRVTGFKFAKTYERGDPSIRTATP